MASHATSVSPPAGRIETIDVWRGFALLGVCVVNFVDVNDLFTVAERSRTFWSAGFDWRIRGLLSLLLTNKAHTIFTFLFGLSFAILFERTRSGAVGERAPLVRRMTVLLVFGLVFQLFIFWGSVLLQYAVLGLALYALRNAPSRVLVAAGVLLAVMPRLVAEEWLFFARLLAIDGTSPGPGGSEAAYLYWRLKTDTALGLVVLNFERAVESMFNPLAVFTQTLYYFGRMLLGYAFWQSGACRRLLAMTTPRLALLVTLLAGLSAVLAMATILIGGGDPGSAQHLATNTSRQLNFLVTAAFYLSLLALMARSPACNWLTRRLSALGRMTLTSYVIQGFLILFIISGPGLRLGGDVGSLVVVLIALAVYVAQVAIAVAWLRRFPYGPFEHAWRTLSSRRHSAGNSGGADSS